jgi:hypothetical protein
MPVAPDVQAAITQRYAQLSAAMSNGDEAAESAVLAPHFHDRAKIKLASFEYARITVMVTSIATVPGGCTVHATYDSENGEKQTTIDHWLKINGRWRLLDRT